MTQPFYRTRGWLIGSTAAIVVGVVVIVIVLTLTGGGPGRPRTPQAAARAWASAQVHHQKPVVTSLQCRADLTTGLSSVLAGGSLSSLTAGTVVSEGSNRWTVPMNATTTSTTKSFDIHVIRRNGDYLVCD